ncbi:MAG: hypothetical protein AAFQ64_18770 [Pseudomonadota bacterium]
MAEVLSTPTETTSTSGGLNPAIADLADVELHAAGQKALDAARQMAPGSSGWRLTRANRLVPQLTVANSSSLRGLSGTNNKSAELGLLLGLVLYRRKLRFDVVAVTGTISKAEWGEVSVGPVAGIAEKCAALVAWLEDRREVPRSMAFVLPAQDNQGASTQLRYKDALEQLRKRATDRGTVLNLLFVEQTQDAIRLLADRRMPLDRREFVARAGLFAMILMLSFLGMFGHWFLSPTKLAFDTVEWSLGPDPQSPLAVRFDRNLGETRPLTPCFGPDQRLQIGFGEHLVFRVSLIEQGWLDRMLPFFDIAVIILGEVSPPMVFSGASLPSTDRLSPRPDGSQGFGAAIPIAPPSEAMKLVILVRKGLSDRSDTLGTRLQSRYHETMQGEHRLARLGALLAAEPGDMLEFDFRAIPGRANCEISG